MVFYLASIIRLCKEQDRQTNTQVSVKKQDRTGRESVGLRVCSDFRAPLSEHEQAHHSLCSCREKGSLSHWPIPSPAARTE